MASTRFRFHNRGSFSGKLCSVPVHPEGERVSRARSRWVSGERKSGALGIVFEGISELTRGPRGAAYAHVVALGAGIEGFGAGALVEFPVSEHVGRTSYGTFDKVDAGGAERDAVGVGGILGCRGGNADGGLSGPRVGLEDKAVVAVRNLCEIRNDSARYADVGSVEARDVFEGAGLLEENVEGRPDSGGLQVKGISR